jgi:hypothetical protein
MRLQFNSDQEYVQAVLSHEDMKSVGKTFYWATNKLIKDAVFYVAGGEIRSNFIDNKGNPMYFYFYLNQPNGYNSQLMVGTRFI